MLSFCFRFDSGDNRHEGIALGNVETDVTRDMGAPTLYGVPQRAPLQANLSDIMILYGTLPGYVAHRHRETGSHYIDVLCDVWAKHAHNKDLDILMKKVDSVMRERSFDGLVQVPSTENWGFSRALYFNPGYVRPSRQ